MVRSAMEHTSNQCFQVGRPGRLVQVDSTLIGHLGPTRMINRTTLKHCFKLHSKYYQIIVKQ